MVGQNSAPWPAPGSYEHTLIQVLPGGNIVVTQNHAAKKYPIGCILKFDGPRQILI
jgi:hypothetical protein